MKAATLSAPLSTRSTPEASSRRGALLPWPNLVAGVALGLVLLMSFYISGRGLGGSGAVARATALGLEAVAPESAHQLEYLTRYFGEAGLSDWLVFQAIGTFLGGLLGAVTAGRFKGEVERGPRVGVGQQLLFALLGGGFMGWGARLARGCTSGQALSGGAMLSLGSWGFMLALFAGGFLGGLLFRRLWT